MNQNRQLTLAAGLLLICGFLFFIVIILTGLSRLTGPAAFPTSDLLATLSALTPGATYPPALATLKFQPTQNIASVSPDQPSGNIVFTCQIFKVRASNQICIMKADGTG